MRWQVAEGRVGRHRAMKRERFARLIARGVGNAEACRVVGVHPKTGKRWRLGRTITSSGGRRLHYPPVISARKLEISPRFLSEDERVRIADLRRAGMGVRAIAGQLGRSPSTISRELRRNCEPGSGQYRPFAAQRLAARRRARPGRGKLNADPVLRQFVAGRLEKRWSPEQISRALRAEFPGEPGAAPGARDDLSGRLPAGAGRATPGPAPGAADRAAAPQAAPPQRRPPGRGADRDDDDQPAARRRPPAAAKPGTGRAT